jgi:hypothetical protein
VRRRGALAFPGKTFFAPQPIWTRMVSRTPELPGSTKCFKYSYCLADFCMHPRAFAITI